MVQLSFTEEWIQRIRNQALEMDQTGQIPEEILNWMYENKLFKLFVPEELGGKPLDLPEALRIFQATSRIEGNIGWLTTIGSGGGAFVPYLEKKWSEQLYSPENAVLAGSGHPNGLARKVDGGYILNGEWRYCSGSAFVTFFTVTSILENGKLLSFALLKEQVEVVEDWAAFGLRGTSSHTIRVKDAFVPEDRMFHLMEIKNDYQLPVHTFPFIPFSQASFTAVVLGIAEHFWEEANRISERRLENARERFEKVLLRIQEEKDVHQEIVNNFYIKIEHLWNKHIQNEEITDKDIEAFGSFCREAVGQCINQCHGIIRLLGMEAIMGNSPINKIWRDLLTAGQHSFIIPLI